MMEIALKTDVFSILSAYKWLNCYTYFNDNNKINCNLKPNFLSIKVGLCIEEGLSLVYSIPGPTLMEKALKTDVLSILSAYRLNCCTNR